MQTRLSLLLLFLCFIVHVVQAVDLPEGFIQEKIADGLDPTAMAELPDGRILLTEKDGKILLVDNGAVLDEPVLSVPVSNFGEWGLMGIVPDPNFTENGYIYYYYTEQVSENNVLARATMNGNTADPNSTTIIFYLDPKVQNASNHNGGALKFGPDGKLYIAVGDGASPRFGQELNTTHGKILRINPDGSIPEDNPFYNQLSGNHRAIWAYGLRNPFSIDIQPGTGLLYASDVGEGRYEEINDIRKGMNYGWSQIEGYANGSSTPENYQDPVYAYGHDQGCSIVGAAFYNPDNIQFPERYVNKFFFGDYCDGYIKVFDPVSGSLYETFATNIDRPIAIMTARDGSLYYIERRGIGGGSNEDNTSSSNGVLWKVTYAEDQTPIIAEQPQSITVPEGESGRFSITVSGATNPNYQWYKNSGELIPNANSASFTIENVSISDDGSTFYCVVDYGNGTLTSEAATLNVTANQRPNVTITSPIDQAFYEAGDTIFFSGTVVDPEIGEVDPSEWTWQIDFHHDTHFHPALDATTGISNGFYVIPSVGHGDTDVWYRVYLTGQDDTGLATTEYVEIFPKLVDIELTSEPEGLDLYLEGKTVTTPNQFESVVGILWTGTAPQELVKDGQTYRFSHWQEDIKEATYQFRADDSQAKVTAHYQLVPQVVEQPQSVAVSVGESATFTVVTAPEGNSYQWYLDGSPIQDATSASLVLENIQSDRNGQSFYCEITFADTVLTSDSATLTVDSQSPPVATITLSIDDNLYTAGDSLFFIGFAEDDKDGDLGPQNWVWQVDFYKDGAIIPILEPFSGENGGMIIPSPTEQNGTEMWYRFSLTVTDSDGLSSTTTVDAFPRYQTLTLNTVPDGLSATVNNETIETPFTWETVVGSTQSLSVSSPQTLNGTTYNFEQWQDGSQELTYTFQAKNIDAITATFSAEESLIITRQPQPQQVGVGQNASFTIDVNLTTGVSFQWYQGGQVIAGATQPTLTIESAGLDQNGQTYYCEVSTDNESITSNTVTLTVLTTNPPTLTLITPEPNTQFIAGDTIFFNGMAKDIEDGLIGNENYSWTITFFSDDTQVEAFGPVTGVDNGFFVTPTTGYEGNQMWYRVTFEATDSDGLKSQTYVDVNPTWVELGITTVPEGISVSVNGKQTATPGSWNAVLGAEQNLEVATSTTLNGQTYSFTGWEDGPTTNNYTFFADEATTNFVANFVLNDGSTPVITSQPQPIAVAVGDNASFSVTTQPVGNAYQWFVDGGLYPKCYNRYFNT